MSDEKQKKCRSANFSAREVELLCNLIVEHSSVLESKKTDAVAWKDKLKHWHIVTNEFNNRNIGFPRTMTSLRTKYDTFKKELRKKVAENKTQLYKTGGGSYKEICLTPPEEAIYNIIYLSTDGLPSRYDDDNLPQSQETDIDLQEGDSDTFNENGRDKAGEEEIIYLETDDNYSFSLQEIINMDNPNNVVDGSATLTLPNCSGKKQASAGTANCMTPSKTKSVCLPELKSQHSVTPTSKWNLQKPISQELQTARKRNTITKLQASQKVNTLATLKTELLQLQIKYYENEIKNKELEQEMKVKKAEAELQGMVLDMEIKQIEKRIKEETLRKILNRHSDII